MPKRLSPSSRSPAPSPRPTPPLAHCRQIGTAGLMGAYPNPRSDPQGPLPRGLAPQRRGLGTPEPQGRTHPIAPPPTRPVGRRRSFRAAELTGPSEAPATIEGPPRQNAWAHAPARQHPHLSRLLRSLHSWRIGPPGLLGAKLNPKSAPVGPIPCGLAPQRRGSGTSEPQRRSQPAALPPPGLLGAFPVIQGGRTGRALLAPWRPSKTPAPKRLGPRFRSPAHSLDAQPADRA